MSILLTGVGNKITPAALPAGYYWRSGAGAADFVAPVAPHWTATALFDDIGASDHTTFEELARPANGDTNFIQALYIRSASATLTTYGGSMFYGVGAIATDYYWDGSAWQALVGGTAWPPHLSSSWQDHTRNPTDQATQYLLVSVEVLGDGVDLDTTKIGDLRPNFT